MKLYLFYINYIYCVILIHENCVKYKYVKMCRFLQFLLCTAVQTEKYICGIYTNAFFISLIATNKKMEIILSLKKKEEVYKFFLNTLCNMK